MRGRYQTLSDKATEQLPLSAHFHPRAGSPPTALASLSIGESLLVGW